MKPPNTEQGSEDCLFINVFTTSKSNQSMTNKLMPVFFWIHGGSFNYGSGWPTLDGVDYIVEQDVVVVTINYRLSVMGFLSIPSENITGNYGLKDQQVALQWVQENIHRFGGDSNHVTLVGWSSGAASINYHMYEETSSHLFDKAIMMSGTMLSHWAFMPDQDYGVEKYLKDLNITRESKRSIKEQLKEIPVYQLMEDSNDSGQEPFQFTFFGLFYFNFLPILDKKFINQIPENLVKLPPINDIPLLIGHTNLEFELWATNITFNFTNFLLKNKNYDIYKKLEFLINDEEVLRTKDNYLFRKLRAMADIIYGVKKYVKIYENLTKSNIYCYKFSYDGQLNEYKLFYNQTLLKYHGAVHGDELGYLFKTNCCDKTRTENDIIVRNRLIKMWTDFIKFG